ncbi:MAG: TIGR04222 domain-containing membrane protein [Acidobacteriota bacterium]|nr:TIGR04222 domain-containing membrane protein [Acidobacteriota bacterium]
MDFLFDNPLANMPGTIFLIFYSLFAILSLIIFGIWKTQADKTANLPIPPIPANIDPYEIAYLRGGMNEVARAVVFALRQKDFLIIQNDGKDSRIHRNQLQADPRSLNQMERDVLNWFGSSREPKEVFQSHGLIRVLEPYSSVYESRLEQQQFLIDDETRDSVARGRNIVLLFVLGLGAYKFIAAITNGYFNVIGILVVAIIATLITFGVARLPRLSRLGKTYLERLQMAFDNLKYQTLPIRQSSSDAANVLPGARFAGVDPLLLGVGVFGGAVLAGTIYDDYNQAFQRAQNQAPGSSSGCGSACGSSCSSSSSGGDGGGDGGGGGCGGCGGGCS